MDPAASEKKHKFEIPPEGEDWLWWHPDVADRGYRVYGARLMVCDSCQVRWEVEVTKSKPIRCWCCGKFKRKPKI